MINFFDRNKSKTAFIVPGWGFDERVFLLSEFEYNIATIPNLTEKSLDPRMAEKELRSKAGAAITLIGWSAGAYQACDLYRMMPGIFEAVCLYGLRPRYPADEIATIRSNIIKNKSAALKQFYKRCFAKSERIFFEKFRKSLMPDYIEKFGTDELLFALEDLACRRINIADIPGEKLRIISGALDAIAPLDEMHRWRAMHSCGELVIEPGRGHLSFLKDGNHESVTAEKALYTK